MSMAADNPREAIGGNNPPDWAKITTDRLADEYKGLIRTLNDLVVEVNGQPEEVATDEQALEIGGLIKRLRDLDAQLENTRAVEKEEPLRKGNAIDAFFNSYRKMIQKSDKNERRTNPGYIDVLQGRINAHQDRKEAAERARLVAANLEAQRIAQAAAAQAAREAAEAEESRLAAERARKPEIVEQKTTIADQKEVAAVESKITADVAQCRAEDARIATLARSADLVRVQGNTTSGAGVTLTTAKEPYAYVIDRDKLDPIKLFRFFTDAEVDKALRAFAKNTGHREQMAGAEIGFGRKGVTR